MRGRKPVPSHLKVIRGTARKDRAPKNEPQPKGELLVAPDYLSDRQAQERSLPARCALAKPMTGRVSCSTVMGARHAAK